MKNGAMIEPRNKPNLNQSLFGNTNIFGNKIADTRNINEIIKAKKLIDEETVNGYMAIIKNTNEKTKPKDFSEPF